MIYIYKSEEERLQRAVTYKVNCIDNIIQRYIHIYIYTSIGEWKITYINWLVHYAHSN